MSQTAQQPANTPAGGRPPFICLEGIDGVGKSATARALARRLGAHHYRTPPPPFDAIRRHVDATGDFRARYHFYLAAVHCASVEIASLVRSAPVVCDRYLYSTLAYHAPLAGQEPSLGQFAHLFLPSPAILLTVAEDLRRERLARRGLGRLPDAQWEADPAYLAQVQEQFRSFGLVELDTTGLTPEQAAEKIIQTNNL